MNEYKESFPTNPDRVVKLIIRLLERDNLTREILILENSYARIESTFSEDNGTLDCYILSLRIPEEMFFTYFDTITEIEEIILEKGRFLLNGYPHSFLKYVNIGIDINVSERESDFSTDPFSDNSINNQSRVFSGEIAPIEFDFLFFRSEVEISLYKALKASGLPFAPLAVFIKGGGDNHRIEPDFFIIKNGIMIVVEVDGDQYHNRLPAVEHERLAFLDYEGVQIIRVRASDIGTQHQANIYVKQLIDELIPKLKENK